MVKQSVVDRPSTREERALALFRERGSEIEEYGPNMWRVPSCSGKKVYSVVYGDEDEWCDCPDFQHRGENCKHLMAVAIKNAKVRPTRKSHGCLNGVVYLTYEEDGHEWTEPVPCRRCNG